MALDPNLLNSITSFDERMAAQEIAQKRQDATQIGNVLGSIPGYAKAKRASNWWMEKDLAMDAGFETDSGGNPQFSESLINFNVGSMSDEWEKYKSDVGGFMGHVGTKDYVDFQQAYNSKYPEYANKIAYKLQSMENRGVSKRAIKNLINSSPQFKESLIRLDSMSPESGLSEYLQQAGFFPTAWQGIYGDSAMDPTAIKAKAAFEGVKGWRAGLGKKEIAKNMFGPSAETKGIAKKAWAKMPWKQPKATVEKAKVKFGGKQTTLNLNTKGTQTKASKGAMNTIRTFIKKNGLKKTMSLISKKLGWKGVAKLFGKGVASIAGKVGTPFTGGVSGAASLALDAATAVQIAKVLKDSVSEMQTKSSVKNLKF